MDVLPAKGSPERLTLFSDAVFAVLITILVLELRPPELPTFNALLSLWPAWLSYAVSYLFIAIVWANHHYLMRYATEVTPRLMWFNFAHLFSVSLLPLSTAWMATSRLAPQPVAFYAAVFVLRQRDLHLSDLGTYCAGASGRCCGEGAPNHARPFYHHALRFRGGCGRCTQISACWACDVYLLPDRLLAARSAKSGQISAFLSLAAAR
jgi:Endosomal/lysosomal potassium channel TMEM175